MGQHKHNPTAISAKAGKLPPKPEKMTKRQREQVINDYITDKLFNKLFNQLSTKEKCYNDGN